MPKFRIVTGLFKAAVNDGPDADHSPDMVALNGRVRFVPLNRHGAVAYPRLDPPRFISPEPIEAILLDGMLLKQELIDEQLVAEPVELLVSDDDEAIERWQWQVSFHEVRIGGRDGELVELPAMRFTLSEDTQPLDLTEVVGESRGSGQLVVKGPRGAGLTDIRAENGELIVEWGADKRLVIPVPDAVPGPKGDKGDASTVPGPPGTVDLIGGSATITVSKQVGTSVRIGDVRVHYDSGWRVLPNPPRFTSGRVLIRRQDDRVTLRFEQVQITGLTESTRREWLTSSGFIPEGFYPVDVNGRPAAVFPSNSLYGAGLIGVASISRLIYLGPVTGMIGDSVNGAASGEMHWTASSGLPTTLPGTAA